jgi:molybdenum cofactor synthesis domain-containing protein
MTSREIEVVSVNVSEEKGTGKRPVGSIVLDERGVVGDAHAGWWHRQVSALGLESLEAFARRTGTEVRPGDFAENLTVRGLEGITVRLLDRFRVGEAELEVTQIGKECHGEGCAIFQQVGSCLMPREGVFCRVRRGGVIRAGMAGVLAPKVWRFRVVTLSDRASRGEYADQSGPRVRELLAGYLERIGWPGEIESALLADEAEAFRRELEVAREAGVDVVISTGGTGVGPRDIAPETVGGFCERLVPGIPEGIRAKFGATNPRAWLSRAVVGIAGTMVVYTLPGSVRAVEEYMGEILRTMEHLLHMVHGVEGH